MDLNYWLKIEENNLNKPTFNKKKFTSKGIEAEYYVIEGGNQLFIQFLNIFLIINPFVMICVSQTYHY